MIVTWGKLILFLLAFSCFLLVAINCAGPSWGAKEGSDYKYEYGLWEYCINNQVKTVCAGYTNLPSWMHSVRALTIISTLVLFM